MTARETPGVTTERKKIPVAAMRMMTVTGSIRLRSPRLAWAKSWLSAMSPVTETSGSSEWFAVTLATRLLSCCTSPSVTVTANV
jgi:hypothetical protein